MCRENTPKSAAPLPLPQSSHVDTICIWLQFLLLSEPALLPGQASSTVLFEPFPFFTLLFLLWRSKARVPTVHPQYINSSIPWWILYIQQKLSAEFSESAECPDNSSTMLSFCNPFLLIFRLGPGKLSAGFNCLQICVWNPLLPRISALGSKYLLTDYEVPCSRAITCLLFLPSFFLSHKAALPARVKLLGRCCPSSSILRFMGTHCHIYILRISQFTILVTLILWKDWGYFKTNVSITTAVF